MVAEFRLVGFKFFTETRGMTGKFRLLILNFTELLLSFEFLLA